ncbi:hypothetical protein LCGC14_0581680 [marine sediment metagenome]|uniref:Uncharacterized protein n=1 Tax=marine sediment metagenome TaxID=412755 RepID=A0A0F9UPF9_9ZZZZ
MVRLTEEHLQRAYDYLNGVPLPEPKRTEAEQKRMDEFMKSIQRAAIRQIEREAEIWEALNKKWKKEALDND